MSFREVIRRRYVLMPRSHLLPLKSLISCHHHHHRHQPQHHYTHPTSRRPHRRSLRMTVNKMLWRRHSPGRQNGWGNVWHLPPPHPHLQSPYGQPRQDTRNPIRQYGNVSVPRQWRANQRWVSVLSVNKNVYWRICPLMSRHVRSPVPRNSLLIIREN